LANCLIHSDYHGTRGIVIINKPDEITISNPGGFRIELEAAKSGGISDPRNTVLMKMFTLIDIGERAGSGIPNIYSVWNKQGWSAPTISEEFDPERITLSLPLKKAAIKSGDKKAAIKSGDKKAAIKTLAHKQAIIEYLTTNASAKSSELAELVGLKSSRLKEILSEMISDDIIVPEGNNKNRRYKLKS